MAVRVLRTASSTIVFDAEYDSDAEALRIRLHRGGEVKRGHYEYTRVPEWLFDKLCAEEAGAQTQGRGHMKGQKPYSVGTFFHRYIRRVFPETYVRSTRQLDSAWPTTAEPAGPSEVEMVDAAADGADEDDDIAGPVSRMIH